MIYKFHEISRTRRGAYVSTVITANSDDATHDECYVTGQLFDPLNVEVA